MANISAVWRKGEIVLGGKKDVRFNFLESNIPRP
jgi:hypothetical protein